MKFISSYTQTQAGTGGGSAPSQGMLNSIYTHNRDPQAHPILKQYIDDQIILYGDTGGHVDLGQWATQSANSYIDMGQWNPQSQIRTQI